MLNISLYYSGHTMFNNANFNCRVPRVVCINIYPGLYTIFHLFAVLDSLSYEKMVREMYEFTENTSLAAPGALAHRLQHLPTHFIQNGRWGPGIGQTLGYWTLRSTFAK